VLKATWRERNGPRIERPNADGTGGALIERAIPNAKVKRDFARAGLVCTIEVPLPS
jgi:two-component system, chemotaxis family, CheB/CheR fusion protein